MQCVLYEKNMILGIGFNDKITIGKAGLEKLKVRLNIVIGQQPPVIEVQEEKDNKRKGRGSENCR